MKRCRSLELDQLKDGSEVRSDSDSSSDSRSSWGGTGDSGGASLSVHRGHGSVYVSISNPPGGRLQDTTDGRKNGRTSNNFRRFIHRDARRADDVRKLKNQQLALVSSNQAINRCDVKLFGSVINLVEPLNLPILLFDACENNLIKHVDLMLDSKDFDVDPTMECEKPEKYPILVAARKGYYQIIISLLKKIKSLGKLNDGLKQTNIWGNTIFHIIVKSLSKSRKDEKSNKSDHDIYYKSMEVLMEYKEDFEDNLIIEEDYSLICDASEENLSDFVELLLQQGVNPLIYFKTRDKRNPLQLACSNGNYSIVKILINHIEQKETSENEILKDFLNYKDEGGNTALHIILSGKDKEIKEKNEKNKAVDVNITCDLETHMDAEDNYLSCMKLVLEKKEIIDIDTVNIFGNTALHKATKLFNEQRFAKLLIDNGARTDIKNKRGFIAEVFNSNHKAEDTMKNKIDQILDDPGQNLNSVQSIVEGVSGQELLPNNIGESTNLLKEALTNGNYLRVKELFDNVNEKKLQFSDKVIRSFLDIIVKGQNFENTEKLHQSSEISIEQQKKAKKIKKCKGNNNVNFNKCMDVVLKYNHAKAIIDQVLYTVCDKGILNLVEPLLRYGANYIQPISEKYKCSALQIAFKNGYHLIAKKLLEKGSPIELQCDIWVKEVLENIVNGFMEKKGIQCRGTNKKGKRKKQEGKGREISSEKENEQNYRKCFEILLDPKLQFLNNYKIRSDQDLLNKICANGLTELVDCLIDNESDPCVEFEYEKNKEFKGEKSPIHVASRYGYHELVDLLLNKMEERGVDIIKQGLKMTNKWENLPIHNIVRSVTKKDKNEKRKEDLNPEIDYYKCLESLLKFKEHYNIDEQDCQGNTALHYAIQLRDDHRFVKLLLMNGSQMTIKNNKHIIAKTKIVPSLIEEILDSCIKAEGDESVVDDLRLTIDLSIFSHRHYSKTKTETDLLIALRNSSKHKHLLYHPVFSTFLYIKWQKIRTLWYINLILYMLFFSCLISYICYMDQKPNNAVTMLSLKVIISVMSVYMLIREIVQLCIFKFSYFKSFDNLLEISLLVMTMLLLYLPNSNIRHEFTAWIVVGSIAEFVLLFGKMPLFQCSIYITMFKRVTFNFLKIIVVLFLWIILAFSFSFYIMFKGNQNLTSFITFSQSLLRTTVMSTGELEYTDMDKEFESSYPVSSRLLFTAFMFVIVFVTMNLVNGIAISDIQIIQKEAQNHAIMAEAECIIGINETLKMVMKILRFSCLERLWNFCLIFDDCFTKKSIALFPNRHYEDVWATCEGHPCSFSKCIKINHCPYYFWLNVWNFYDILQQLRYIKLCNDCKLYYDKRVNKSHKCEKKYECAVCRRYKYSNEKPIKTHICLHRHRYYIKSMSVEAAKDVVIKQKQEVERKQKEEKEKSKDERQSQIFKRNVERQSDIQDNVKQLQTTVNELTEIIKKLQNQ